MKTKTETSRENEFKVTEIGLIPKDWELSELTKEGVAKLIMGQSPPSSTYNEDKEGLPFLQGKAEFGREYPLPEKWCTKPSRIAEKNDVLISVRAPVGDVNISPFQCAIGRGLAAIRADRKSLPYFLFYYLQYAKKRIEEKGTGSTFKAINKSVLQHLKIILPEISEQQKITFVLLKIQQAIEYQEKLIKITIELKKSLMHKLFTEGLHDEEQKETEIGLIPKSWEIVEVDSLGEIVTGTTPPTKNKRYYEGGGFQFISPVDLGDTKYVHKTEKEISLEGLKVSRVLPKDAVLVVCIGSTTGKVGLTFKDKSTTNQQINTVICNEEFNPHFIYYLLDFKSDYIRSLSTPSPVPILSKGKFQRAMIPMIKNKREQDKIAEILSAIDEKIEKAKYHKQTLQSLFKTMLNQLMTGTVRVKNLDIEVN